MYVNILYYYTRIAHIVLNSTLDVLRITICVCGRTSSAHCTSGETHDDLKLKLNVMCMVL